MHPTSSCARLHLLRLHMKEANIFLSLNPSYVSPFDPLDADGDDDNAATEVGAMDDGDIFVSNGSVLPDLKEIREEGYTRRQW